MKKILLICLVFYLCHQDLFPQSDIEAGFPDTMSYLYFDQTPPGDSAIIFAPGIISLDDRYEYDALYSNDGNEFYFTITTSGWGSFHIFYMKKEEDGEWTDPAEVPFSLGYDLSPVFSSDGQKIYFSSQKNIYKVEREGNSWTTPTLIPDPVSSANDEWTVHISGNETLYFSSTRSGGEDIFRSKLIDGQYLSVENLGKPVNSGASEDGPCIAPDESFLIFTSRRTGGYGDRDLYISYRKEDSTWTSPKNLGPKINKECFTFSPILSPDGKYLFFSRRYAWDSMDIYWVGTNFIDSLKTTNFPPYVKHPIPDQTVYIGSLFLYTIPDSVFFDDDGNETLTLTNETGLPGWLDYDPDTKTFSGTPEEEESISVTVMATDTAGAAVSDVFRITVQDPNITDNQSIQNFRIYPNPASGQITIDFGSIPREQGVIEIFDTGGKLVYTRSFKDSIKEIINDHDLLKGMYWISVTTDLTSYTSAISIE